MIVGPPVLLVHFVDLLHPESVDVLQLIISDHILLTLVFSGNGWSPALSRRGAG
jgi:hypothetical protein